VTLVSCSVPAVNTLSVITNRRATRNIGDISAASWHIGRMSITAPWHDLVSKAARYQTIQIGTV
jgi:hypothetical protein